jgi:hypothetical protein
MSGFDNISQNIFGLIALVISLVALSTTVLQVLQQYFSSAEGYRRCRAFFSDETVPHSPLAFHFRFSLLHESSLLTPSSRCFIGYGALGGRDP